MSKIEWTEKTWNPITGCNKVSAGCANCYAEANAKRFWGKRAFTDIMLHEDRLTDPLRRKKPTMYFVNSMSDIFHEHVSTEYLAKIFAVMWLCDQHTFQVLTKREYRMQNILNSKSFLEEKYRWCNIYHHEYIKPICEDIHFYEETSEFRDNIWLGVSIEKHSLVHRRVPALQKTPAEVKFLSIEPLLEETFLFPLDGPAIHWVIIGCESGPQRRPCKIEWIETIVAQCKDANVPVFVKQISVNGKVIKDIAQFPKHLQIREYPKIKSENKYAKILFR